MRSRLFANLSIRVKLLAIVMLTSCIALFAAGIGIVAYDSVTFKQQKIDDVAAQADILAATSSAALEFNDAKAAQEYLSALAARHDVASAVIYDAAGDVFAKYRRNPGAGPPDPARAEPDGIRTEDGDLLLFRRIVFGGETIGTVHLRVDLDRGARLLSYAGIVTVVLIGALLLALLLSTRLQALVSEPLLEVTQVAQLVIERQDYSRRVIKHSSDEIGVLVDAFNEMLAQIQAREAALQAANQSLQLEIAEHKAARAEVAALNQNLEKRVAERTTELETVNKELESFSYSVSHDLRAPLRAIDGFTAILLDSHAAQLDEQGLKHLGRVRAATQRMGQLIDDLLELSRTARSEMRRTQVDLSAMALAIAADLRDAAPARSVEVTVASDLRANADPDLIRAVLENLLGNAWKFTGRTDAARIEVGQTETLLGRAIFVRDNGAGFDMKYANKLFSAFTRLHAATEYQGTGVGLANVQRIVQRHGGTVWTEAAVGKGATFFFTLAT